MAKQINSDSDWAAATSERLAAAGYRRGGARAAVIELLAEQSCALSAYEIEAQLVARKRAVGRASIYRVLDELEALGVVSKVELGQGQARYEPVRPEHHHHHLVCDSCGAVIPFDDRPLELAVTAISKRVDFAVEGHEIVLHGLCAACRP